MVKEEAKSSQYGYLLGFRGMCRVKLPDFDHHLQSDDTPPELNIESVFPCGPERLPLHVALFSSHHNVYFVGGFTNDPQNSTPMYNLHVFDPTTHAKEEFPVNDLTFLDKPIDLPPNNKFKPIVNPIVFQPKNHHHIYFLTQYWSPWRGSLDFRQMCFQSFDPTNNTFRVLPSPPYERPSRDHFREVGCFVAGDYIYLFIQDHLVSYIWHHDNCKYTRAFSFNTVSSKWKEIEETVSTFRRKEIPIPFFHRGDVGLSQEFHDKTRIMVATCDTRPIAYCVRLGANGSLRPKSYRGLLQSHNLIITGRDSQLHDIGSGRFLVFFKSNNIPLMLYVFQIDYEREHQIQNSAKFSPTMFSESATSSEILCSRKFCGDIPLFGYPSFYAYCLASAPASQSSCNQNATAEEQDGDGKTNKRIEVYSHKRKREQCTREGREK